jgi:hypothetical protein
MLVAATIMVSCSDAAGPASEPLADDPTLTPTLTPNDLRGGGWTPAIEAAGRKAGKIDVCHSGNGNHFSAISISVNATRAHLGDPATGIGGHSDDYRISDLTPCPPPATPGIVQVCKVAGNGIATGASYSFRITANDQTTTVTVPAGAGPGGTCVDAGSFRIGTDVTVQEVAQPNVNVTGLTIVPAGAQLGLTDLANRRARVVVGIGSTTLTYTNTSTTHGSLIVCKVAGTGVTAGTNFEFTVAGQTVMVPAGAAPGNCSAPVVAPAGNVTTTETAAPGTAVSAITATGAGGANVLVSSDLAARTATASLAAGGLTTVTYTNSATTGTLVICKIAGTGITAGANFSFTVGSQTVTVAAGAAPNGTCSAPLTVPTGSPTVTETAVAGTSVSAIGGAPAVPTNINLPARSATVLINNGQETRITFTNTAP